MKEALYDFFFGSNNKRTDYLYDTPHLVAIVSVIVFSVIMILIAKRLNDRQKRRVLWVLFSVLLAFEILHRVYRFVRGHPRYDYILTHFSSITAWLIIIAAASNNKHLLNLSAISGILSSVSFLAYPGVGFDGKRNQTDKNTKYLHRNNEILLYGFC